jgi:ketosteroid isomerase-like protein
MTTENVTTTDLDEIARKGFAAIARRDLSRPEPTWADHAVDHFVPVGDAFGRDAIVAFFREMFAALPDFTVEVEHTVARAPFVVVQWHGIGTFTWERSQSIRATRAKIDFRGCDVVEIRDGLVVDSTVYWDGAGFARKVGPLPPQGSLADRALLRSFNAFPWVRTLGRRPGRKQHHA